MLVAVGFLQNAALLVSMVIIGVRLLAGVPKRSLAQQMLLGLLFGAVCIILSLTAANSPIDARPVFLFISALFAGWLPAAVAALVSLIHGVITENTSMLPVMLAGVLLISVAAGWLCSKLLKNITWWAILLASTVTHLLALGYLLLFHELSYLRTLLPGANSSSQIVDIIVALALGPVVAAICGVVVMTFRRQHQQEAEQQKQARLFRSIYNNANAGLFHCDAEGRYLDMNKAMAQILGFIDPEEAITSCASTSDDLALMQRSLTDTIALCVAEGQIRGYVMTISTDQGHEKTINISIWKLPDPDDGHTVYEGVAVDMSEQTVIQKQLRESEAKYRSYVEHAPLGVTVANRALQYLEVNDAACRATGYSREELLSMSVWQIFAPDEMNTVLRCKEELINKGTTTAILRCLTKTGDSIYCRIDAVMLSEDRILGLVTNITEVVKARQELETQKQVTINLVDTAMAGYWDWNMKEDTVYCSRGLASMLGYVEGDFIDGKAMWNSARFDEDLQSISDAMNSHVSSHGTVPFHHRMRMKHRDGHTIWVIGSGYVVEWDDDDQPVRMVGSYVDVSAMKAAEDEIVSLNRQLEEKLSALEKPAGDTSKLGFTDLFDIDEIQKIQDAFAKTSGVASVIVDVAGYRITHPSNYCTLCRDVIRGCELGKKHCIEISNMMNTSHPDAPMLHYCMDGCMLEGSATITIDGRHIATWMYGQVMDETADEEKMMQYAEELGVDELQYAQALPFVKRMSRSQFESVGQTLQAFANQLSQQAVQNAKQALYISERRQAERALRASEQRYQQLFNEMSSGFLVAQVVLDASGIPLDFKTIGINRQAEILLGVRAEDVMNKSIRDVFPNMEHRWIQRFCDVAMTGHPVEFQEFFRPTSRHYQVHAYMPEPLHFAVLFDDATEKIAAEQERKQFEQRLEQTQKLEGLGVLAGGIAHDFNNILMSIMGNADIALLDSLPQSDAYQCIGEIKNSTNRAAELCRQMLTYSGRTTYNMQQIDVRILVMELVELLRAGIPKKIKFHLHIPPDLPPIMAEDAKIRQVLVNLIVNASEAIGDNSGTISVSVKIQQCTKEVLAQTVLIEDVSPGKYMVCAIADNGCGMDDATIQRLFEPFFTTKFTGRGLGMSSVLGIIRGHRGTIAVESTVGKGSTIRLYLPVDVEHPELPSGVDTSEIGAWRGNGTVLLVDDEESIREVGRQMLIHIGFDVLTASDGREAIEVYRGFQQQISLVLLDMTMPDLDGVDTFRALRRIDPKVKVVISSGYAEKDVELKFAAEHVDGFIAKPYTLAELREHLYRYLR
ncbi:MAG: PAS domain S-box protein [Armatimonadota bacterium]